MVPIQKERVELKEIALLLRNKMKKTVCGEKFKIIFLQYLHKKINFLVFHFLFHMCEYSVLCLQDVPDCVPSGGAGHVHYRHSGGHPSGKHLNIGLFVFYCNGFLTYANGDFKLFFNM